MPTYQGMELFQGRFIQFGINPTCRKCQCLKGCENPQYNAPGLITFFCGDNKKGKEHHDKN